jgi:uncharacterized protein DUF5916/cellulose/xylan binding protein with CBM9 domain
MTFQRFFFLPLALVCGQIFSQSKSLQALKTAQPPRIDGSLDDIAWQSAPVASGFIQNFPQTGQASIANTVVKILYDNSAIYVGAMLYDDPSLIRKQLTARDEEQQSDVDYFSVFFDTYNDNQNGFQFLVTAANVQTDVRLAPTAETDFGVFGDKTWDAVWESQTSITADGWIVEMKIPYISLRFPKKSLQDWGLQFLRVIRRNNETSFWNPVDPNVDGILNQFGDYTGIKDLEPPLRLSFSPYLSGGVNISPLNGKYRTEWLKSGGMDVKYGLSESFTLDATLIPDFGQVVSDNVVNNLTPFEIRFAENRPFFTEGTELFNKSGLFYSRRVGEMPEKYGTAQSLSQTGYEIIENPAVATLYNAIKFSGRNRNKLGIGFFNAITASEEAVVRNNITGIDSVFETEPLANYNIIVLDQAFKNRSYLTFTNTNVLRSGSARDANVTAVDLSFFDKRNIYNFKGGARYSKVFGSNSYDGFNTNMGFAKVSGKIQYQLLANIESDMYDPNDLGFNLSNNEILYSGVITYNQFTPTKNFLTYTYSFASRYGWLYKPYAFTQLTLNADAFWVFKNFWDVSLGFGSLPYGDNDYFVLRTPGRYVKRPAFSFVELEGSTDSRKRWFFKYEFLVSKFHIPEEHKYHVIELGFRYRFSNKFTMDIENRKEAETDFIVFAGRELNDEPIVAFVDFNDITTILSGVYNFTPRLNCSMRARHNWSKVLYNSFANVSSDGKTIPRPFIPGQDENENFFNLDAFLTWDFRLGSRLVLGWKNFLGSDEFVDGGTYKNYLRNLGQIFDLRHGNEVTLRFIYFLDYNQFRKKK